MQGEGYSDDPMRDPVSDGAQATGRYRDAPLVGLIRNARSHRNAGGRMPDVPSHNIILRAPRQRSDLAAILADFAQQGVEIIVIDGGDGTVRDVLTAGWPLYREGWPALVVIPSGKTNALAQDLGVPASFTLEDALAAAPARHVVERRPLLVSAAADGTPDRLAFVMGAGAFTRAIALGQKSHKLGAFNAAVLGLTAAWSVLQAMLGRAGNDWRRGSRMTISRDGEPLPHRGGLPADERYLLLASSLQRFGAGLDPFRGIDSDVQVAVMDNPRRAMLLRFAAIARGRAGRRVRDIGYHVFGTQRLSVELGEPFILDGEAFAADTLTVTPGPVLRFIVP